MEKRNELYLVVMSILLGISVLKITEVFQLAEQIKVVLGSSGTLGLSVSVVGVFLFTGSYLVFYLLMGITSYRIVGQLRTDQETVDDSDLGANVAMCVAALVMAYLIVFSVAIYTLAGGSQPVP